MHVWTDRGTRTSRKVAIFHRRVIDICVDAVWPVETTKVAARQPRRSRRFLRLRGLRALRVCPKGLRGVPSVFCLL